MSKADIKSLFVAYQASDDAVTAAKEALAAAMADRSVKVQAIQKAAGSGPFQWNGKTVKLTKRETKNDEGIATGVTYFFKSLGDEIMKIE